MARTFSRKCSYCDRLFNHWRSHWNHEKKCPIRAARTEHLRKSSAWQRRPAQTPEEIAAAPDPFKGFRDEDSTS